MEDSPSSLGPWSPLHAAAPFFCLLAFSIGCGPSTEMRQELDSLRTEITGLRASTAAMTERLDALEIQAGAFQARSPQAPPTDLEADQSSAPELPVVRLGPGSDEPSSAPEPSPARVKIRSTPGGLVQEEVRTEDTNSGPAPKTTPAPPKNPPKNPVAVPPPVGKAKPSDPKKKAAPAAPPNPSTSAPSPPKGGKP